MQHIISGNDKHVARKTGQEPGARMLLEDMRQRPHGASVAKLVDACMFDVQIAQPVVEAREPMQIVHGLTPAQPVDVRKRDATYLSEIGKPVAGD